MEEKAIVQFVWRKLQKEIDLEIPLSITANELIYGLNQGLNLGINMDDVSQCYLATENPIALLRGDIILEEFGIHNGTKLFYTR